MEEEETKTYYLVGLEEENVGMIPVGKLIGRDGCISPLFTTKIEVRKYCDYMRKQYPDEKYCCLKAVIMEE